MEVDRCCDLREHFAAYVTDAGEPKLAERIRLHLAGGCVACAGEIDELDAAFYTLGRVFAAVAPGEGSTDAMAAAITRRHQEAPEEPILFAEHNENRLAWWLVALFAVALLAAAFWGRGEQEKLHSVNLTLHAAQVQTREVIDDYRQLQERAGGTAALLDALTNPRVTTHDVAGDGGTRVRAFVDLEKPALTLTVVGLKPGAEEQLAVYWQQGEAWRLLGPLERRIAEGGGGRLYGLPPGASLPARFALSQEALGELPAQPTKALVQGELVVPVARNERARPPEEVPGSP